MISLTKKQINQIISHSENEAPAEACGLLAGKNKRVVKVYPMTNDEHSGTRYLVNPKEQFRAFKQIRGEGLKLIGIYHSHVASEAYPSKTDCNLAAYNVAYFIISLQNKKPEVRAFRINNSNISEEKFKIVDRVDNDSLKD